MKFFVCLRVLLFIWIHYLFACENKQCHSLYAAIGCSPPLVAARRHIKCVCQNSKRYESKQYNTSIFRDSCEFFSFCLPVWAVALCACEWHFSYSNGTWFFTLHSNHSAVWVNEHTYRTMNAPTWNMPYQSIVYDFWNGLAFLCQKSKTTKSNRTHR